MKEFLKKEWLSLLLIILLIATIIIIYLDMKSPDVIIFRPISESAFEPLKILLKFCGKSVC